VRAQRAAALLLVLALVAHGGAWSQQDSQPYAALIAQAQAALKAKDWAGAETLLRRVVSIKPQDPEAHYMLGRAFSEQKKYQPATLQFEETLKIAPRHTAALIDLAHIAEFTGRYDDAGKRWREAIAAGGGARAQRGLASLLSRQGDADTSIKMLEQLVSSDAGDIDARQELAMARMQAGDCQAAVADFQAVIAKRPDDLGALLNLGNCLNRIGRRNEAAAALQRFTQASHAAQQREASDRRAYFLVLDADKKLQAGQVDAALKILDEAVAINPGDARAHAVRAQTLEAKKNDAGALSAWMRAVELSPSDPVMLVEAGRLLGKAGRMQEAINYFRRAAVADPRMPEPHMMLAAAYHRLGRAQEGMAEEAIFRKLDEARKAQNP
jgi:Flp pilus assembly protein TadD